MDRSSRLRTLAALGAALLLGACTGAPPAPPAPAPPQPVLTPTACPVPPPEGLTAEQVRCGTVRVPPRYDRPDAGTIGIPVVVVRATASPARPDPLVVLGGGPGDDVIALSTTLGGPASPTGRFAPDRDVVWLNQRGTNHADPALQCPEVGKALAGLDLPSADQAALVAEADRTCAARLRDQGVDLAAFGTVANAKDLEQVRLALGYPAWNLWGGSYGTRLVLEALRQTGSSGIRSAILSSPVPTQLALPEAAPAAYQGRLDALFAACAAEPACAGAHGDLRAALDAGIARLTAAPRAQVATTADGRTATVLLDAPRVAQSVWSLMYSRGGVAALPAIIAALGAGDDAPLATALVAALPAEVTGLEQAFGMQRVVWCNDIASQATPEGLAAAAAAVTPVAGRLFLGAGQTAGQFGPAAFDTCRTYGLQPGAVHEPEPATPSRATCPPSCRPGSSTPSRRRSSVRSPRRP